MRSRSGRAIFRLDDITPTCSTTGLVHRSTGWRIVRPDQNVTLWGQASRSVVIIVPRHVIDHDWFSGGCNWNPEGPGCINSVPSGTFP